MSSPFAADREPVRPAKYECHRPQQKTAHWHSHCFGGNGRTRPGPNLGALFGSVKFGKVIRRLQRDIECAAFICRGRSVAGGTVVRELIWTSRDIHGRKRWGYDLRVFRK